METQTNTNKTRKLAFVALASLTMITSACSKNNGGGNAAPPVVVTPQVCPMQPCMNGIGGVGGQMLYGGTTTNGYNTQAQFQVSGNPSGNGPGGISGTVKINNYVCPGQPNSNLNGVFTIQMTQQGQLTADVFTGNVNLVGPQGAIPAAIKVVPTRTQNDGLFALWLCGSENDMNF